MLEREKNSKWEIAFGGHRSLEEIDKEIEKKETTV